MEIDKKIQKLELNVSLLFDMLSGATAVTTHLVENILSPSQRADFSEWLAQRASETQESGRVYLAQVGNALTKEQRFGELIHTAGREFLEQKQADLEAGKPILG